MDADEDGRWMTYAELADLRGIDQHSVRRMAHRSKWRRQKDNHGTVRIFVPAAQAARPRKLRDKSAAISTGMSVGAPADLSVVIRPLEAAIAALREQLEQANSRAHRAEQGRDGERTRADAIQPAFDQYRSEMQTQLDQAEAGRDAERQRANELANRLLVVQAAADRAEAEADELRRQAEAAQIGQAEAEADAAELRQAEAARKGRGVLARLRAAWRGE